MAIRFLCVSCQQPIEIDDAWASRAVLCPFCRTTVVAPQTSTLTDLSDIPAASPVGEATATPRAGAPETPAGARNRIAVVAFVLACLTMLLTMIVVVIMSSHWLELRDIAERIQAASVQSKPPMQVMADYMAEHGGVMPGWWITWSITLMSAGVTLLAGAVCAVIGLLRPVQRGFAVAALLLDGALISFLWVSG